MVRKMFSLILTITFLVLTVCVSFASETQSDVLPKGIWRVRTYYIYGTAAKSYNRDGDKVELIPDVETTDAATGTALGLGATHVFGTITGDGKLTASVGAFVVEYGITDKLVTQILVPTIYNTSMVYGWGWTDNDADDAYLTGIGLSDDPLGPAALAAYQAAAPDQKGSGLGDIEVGAKYRFINTKDTEVAVAVGARLATGKKDDPNDAKDFYTGDGQNDLGFQLYGDKHFTNKISLGGYVKYESQLEATFDRADVLGGGNYKKNLGDMTKILVCLYGKGGLNEGLETGLGFGADYKGKDKEDGINVDDSETSYYYIKPKAEYTCLKYKIPYKLVFEYNYPIGGKNTVVLNTLQVGIEAFLKF